MSVGAARWLRRAAPFAVSAACLWLLAALFRDRLPAVIDAVRGVDPLAMAAASLAYLLVFYVLALRMQVVLRALGVDRAPTRLFLCTLIGQFFSSFLPTSMGGDVVKAGYAVGDAGRVADVFLATLLDRALGLVAIIMIGSIGLVVFPGLELGPSVLWLPGALLAGLVAVTVACHVERWTGPALRLLDRAPLADRLRLPRLARATLGVIRRTDVLGSLTALTIAAVALTAWSLSITARALGIEVGYAAFLLVVPVVTVISLVPSINGIGVREAGFVLVLRGIVPEEQALALSIIFYVVGMACSAVGGLVFLARKPLGLGLSPSLTVRFSRPVVG